ncbi:MAG: EscU/YscU/HrcU family type III secretion system export apparatus switch protein [Pseudomonadota bacterium]
MSDGFDDGFQDSDKNRLNPLNKKEKPERQTAVALKDRTIERKVPEILAAGRGNIAEQILQLAYENDIHVREDSDLAEMLAKIEIDSPIPSEAFAAVAEILSYVYRANGQANPFDAVLRNAMEEDEETKDDQE